jgi:phosphate transport system substrate-binding protein
MNPVLCLVLLLFGLSTGCGPKRAAAHETIRNKGSDTMVMLAQAWAEQYSQVEPGVEVEVSGGGSGQGIASLVKGSIDIANSSRNLKPVESAAAKKNTGLDAKELVIGYDALAVFVNRENPLDEISLAQLAGIYRDDGQITRWSQLGVTLPGGRDKIIRVNRQSSSGTYEFFREHVLSKHDFKLGSLDMNGSKEVVELIASTPGAIGYSGMAFATPEVRMLRVRSKEGAVAFAPSIENVHAHTYPISRSLLLYTLGEARPGVAKYLKWLCSPAGQKLVAEVGYVPLTADSPKAVAQ